MSPEPAEAWGAKPRTLPDDGTYNSENFRNPGGGCQVSCRSSKGFVQVDIQSRCMCISGSSCFKVDIGKQGLQTSNGLGNMGRADGTNYYTLPGSGNSTRWDQDGISMGIESNTAYGKWIHKARDCQGGGQQTLGCIGVPCAMWPEVKKLGLAGKSIQVCNGVDYPTSRDFCPPGSAPCYKNITKERAARDRVGLYVPRKSGGDGSGQNRGQTR